MWFFQNRIITCSEFLYVDQDIRMSLYNICLTLVTFPRLQSKQSCWNSVCCAKLQSSQPGLWSISVFSSRQGYKVVLTPWDCPATKVVYECLLRLRTKSGATQGSRELAQRAARWASAGPCTHTSANSLSLLTVEHTLRWSRGRKNRLKICCWSQGIWHLPEDIG